MKKTNKNITKPKLSDADMFFALMDNDKPSLNRMRHWIIHFSKHEYQTHSDLGGKWLVFCEANEVDAVWNNIKKLQDEKMLGNMAKVSTSVGYKPNKKNHVICVYSYDSSDTADMMRVRDGLRTIGITDVIAYKRDIETINGVYGTPDEFFLHA